MSIAFDGFDVLQRLGKSPEVFAAVRADVDKTARVLVVKCLKAKSVDLDALREMRKTIGDESFELIYEGLKDAEVKSLLTRLDKHHPEIKVGTAAWRRQHLKTLAAGHAEPSLPMAKPAKKATAAKKDKKIAAEPARLQSEVMDLFRRGKTR